MGADSLKVQQRPDGAHGLLDAGGAAANYRKSVLRKGTGTLATRNGSEFRVATAGPVVLVTQRPA
jgi:hypothetical protein